MTNNNTKSDFMAKENRGKIQLGIWGFGLLLAPLTGGGSLAYAAAHSATKALLDVGYDAGEKKDA